MDPKITVIIPVYNTGKYLKAALDSVLAQSVSDFEIIAVNDASTDDSLTVLTDYASRDSRIRIENHEKNKGLLSVRLTGIRAARGKYIMFLDSDDIFLPDVMRNSLDTAEKYDADIVHFPMEMYWRMEDGSSRLVKYAYPYKHLLKGEAVFRKYFVESSYYWASCVKLYRTELCRKAAEFIPDEYCLMAEDFCFYTLCAYWAKTYVPLAKAGYRYYMDSGISSVQKTSLERFLIRQSPFLALRGVRDFLQRQGVWEKYHEAYENQERGILSEYIHRWMRHLPDADRTRAFNSLFRNYDPEALFLAFRSYFSDKIETVPEMLSGEDPRPVPCPEKLEPPVLQAGPHEKRISRERWKEWHELIRENHAGTVILEPDEDPERLLWDILAVRSAGAAAVCRRTGGYRAWLEQHGLKDWLLEDRVLRQASAILVPDEVSAEWYRRRNCAAGISLEKVLPPQRCGQTSAWMLALEKSERKTSYFRIDPSDDGETFVPFFRKLDHLFRKLPDSFRKRFFGFLARSYKRIFNR